MGNYSYLLKVINGNIKLNIEKLREECNEIDKEYKDNNCYMWYIFEEDGINCDTPKIETFEDFANRVAGHKLCGYLIPSYLKKLCRVAMNLVKKEDQNPVMYLEEEGWDRLHYFKFFPETEKVEWGIYEFNFNEKYFEDKYKENNIKDKDIYDYVDEKRNDYIQNIINDENTKWSISYVDYKKEQKEDKTLLLLTLMGIRPNDFLKNPQKYKEYISKF